MCFISPQLGISPYNLVVGLSGYRKSIYKIDIIPKVIILTLQQPADLICFQGLRHNFQPKCLQRNFLLICPFSKNVPSKTRSEIKYFMEILFR